MMPLWPMWGWWIGEGEPQTPSADEAVTAQATWLHGADAGAMPDAETCMRALMEDRMILILNASLEICCASESALETFGFHVDDMQEMPFGDLLHTSHRELFEASHGVPQQRRAQLQHADDSYHWYRLKYASYGASMLIVLEPIDKLVQAERELRAAQMEAEYSSRERGEFLRHMSHELRTPLNAILGFSRMMESGVFGDIQNETYNEYLRLIRQSGEEMLSKIVDLMDLSAIGSHKVALVEEDADLQEVVKAALEEVRPVADGRNISLKLKPIDMAIQLNVDPRLLRKSLYQILKNAVDYNKSGGRVVVHAGIGEAGQCFISIQDNGKGIRQSQLKVLQTALHDSSNLYSNVESYRPIGLGLTLAKEYMHLHDGELEISSRIGRGTHVIVALPAQRVHNVSKVHVAEPLQAQHS